MKDYGDITDQNVQRAVREIQVLEGDPTTTRSTRSGQFLQYRNNLYFCINGGTTEWRKVILDD